MSSLTLTARRAAARRPGLFTRILAMDATFRQRRALAGLTPALRRDLGLTDAEISTEASRPVWDVPASWRR